MKSSRWQAIIAAFCSILAIIALCIWMPAPSGAGEAADRDDPAMKDADPRTKGVNPAPPTQSPQPTNEAIVYLRPGANAALVAGAHRLALKNAFRENPN